MKTMAQVAVTVMLAGAVGGAWGVGKPAGVTLLGGIPPAAWPLVWLGAVKGVLMVLPIAVALAVIGLCFWVFESDRPPVNR